MRIKRLDVFGFKSFPEKTSLVFDNPITGIVGPNGCGKSNIVDAVRWVMGEQRVKTLRGHSREDVIFSGTENRAALGMCEVTLTFDNSDKLAPIKYNDFNEIALCRKLFRNGDSEYLINNIQCRLKDITDLFLGTGAGSKAYSIIEQGHVSLIVGAKANDRRLMIEEAAGITRYHTRKREAERKMEYTRQNLLRVTDIIAELKKQLNSLSRQAKKAERHKEYKFRIKELDLRFTSFDYTSLLEKVNKAVDDISEFELTREKLGLGLTAIEGESKARSLKIAGAEQELFDKQESLHRLDQQSKLDERNLEVFDEDIKRINLREAEIAEELSELEQGLIEQKKLVSSLEEEQNTALKLLENKQQILDDTDQKFQNAFAAFNKQQSSAERLKREIYELMSSSDKAQHQLDTVAQRLQDNDQHTKRNRQETTEFEQKLKTLENEKSNFAAELGGLKKMQQELELAQSEQADKLAREREIYLDLEDKLTHEREQLTAMRSRLDSLMELDKSLEGFSESVKLILADEEGFFEPGELIDALARVIEVDKEYETALGAVLGEKLQWMMVDDIASAKKGVSLLSEKQAGRAGFIAVNAADMEISDDLPDDCYSILDYVQTKDDTDSVIVRLLADVLVAENLEAALSGWQKNPGRFEFVTLLGEVVDRSGALIGGSGELVSHSLLKRKREIENLQEESEKLYVVCEQLSMQRDEKIAAIRELEGTVEHNRNKGHKQEIKILEQQKDLHHIESQLDQIKRRIDSLTREYDNIRQNLSALNQEQEELNSMRADANGKQQIIEKDLQLLQEGMDGLADMRDLARSQQTESKIALAGAKQRQDHLISELKMARERVTDLSSRSERITFENSRGIERSKELHLMVQQTAKQLNDRITEHEKQKLVLDEDKNGLAVEQGEIRELEVQVKTIRDQLNKVTDELNELRLARSQWTIEARHLEDRVKEKYGISLDTEYTEYLNEELPGEEERLEIEQLNNKIGRMGEVNLTAISEYDRVGERYQFLLDQEEDLTSSLTMLEDAIKKINRTTRKRFKETFEQINKRFSELFPKLFGGGQAYLKFDDPNDLLNTGIEIVAQPPGKNLQSVSLLSGGEKALTALSMIFAIFLYRPTPFCLLDEVDAPLDDINITRFNTALRQISKVSQFILITHNKKTMEISDHLYGVTMEEAGISKIVRVDLT